MTTAKEMKALEKNQKIAIESSWLCELFKDKGLSARDKQEILIRAMRTVNRRSLEMLPFTSEKVIPKPLNTRKQNESKVRQREKIPSGGKKRSKVGSFEPSSGSSGRRKSQIRGSENGEISKSRKSEKEVV